MDAGLDCMASNTLEKAIPIITSNQRARESRIDDRRNKKSYVLIVAMLGGGKTK